MPRIERDREISRRRHRKEKIPKLLLKLIAARDQAAKEIEAQKIRRLSPHYPIDERIAEIKAEQEAEVERRNSRSRSASNSSVPTRQGSHAGIPAESNNRQKAVQVTAPPLPRSKSKQSETGRTHERESTLENPSYYAQVGSIEPTRSAVAKKGQNQGADPPDRTKHGTSKITVSISPTDDGYQNIREEVEQHPHLEGVCYLTHRYRYAFGPFFDFLSGYLRNNSSAIALLTQKPESDWECELWSPFCKADPGKNKSSITVMYSPMYVGLLQRLQLFGEKTAVDAFCDQLTRSVTPQLCVWKEDENVTVKIRLESDDSDRTPLIGAQSLPGGGSQGKGQLPCTYPELLSQKKLKYPELRIVVFDTGLNLQRSVGEFPGVYSNSPDGRPLIEYFRVKIGKGVDDVSLEPVLDEKEWQDHSAELHGTHVCVQAVGMQSGVYRGAPLTVLACDQIYEENPKDSTGQPVGMDLVFIQAVQKLWDRVYAEDKSNPYVIMNCSFTFEKVTVSDTKEELDPTERFEIKSLNAWLRGVRLTEGTTHNELFMQGKRPDAFIVAASGNMNMHDQVPLPAGHSRVYAVGACGPKLPRSTRWEDPIGQVGTNTAPANQPPKPDLWAVGVGPNLGAETLIGTSLAAPVAAAKMLFLLQTDGVDGWKKYLDDLPKMNFPVTTTLNQTKIIVICH